MLADEALRALEVAPQGGDAQLVIFDPHDDLVTRADAEALAKRSRNNDAPILIDRLLILSVMSELYD